jgi:predicted membrane-bound spermidine synthase
MHARSRRSSVAIAVAVFLAGAALLGLEIAASRVLAPYFGNSLYVWGALIGVVLAGLSTGYWIGGAIADRYPTPRLLIAMLAAASLLVLAIPFVDDWVLERLVEWDPGPRLNPLLATIFLFGAQSVILGTVSPIAVRLKAHSLDELGRTAGRLFAISTAGSIAGTFATAFWLIPELGTDQVLASAAVALMLAAAGVALVERLLLAGAVTLALAVASLGAVVSLAPDQGGTVAASQLRNWSPVYRQQRDEERIGGPEDAQSGYTILHTKDSQYHRIAVVEDDDSRYLRFDSSFQSGMYKDDPFRTRFEYSDYLQLPLAYRPSTRRILYIGLGGGSAPKRTWRDFPATWIDVVDLDP